MFAANKVVINLKAAVWLKKMHSRHTFLLFVIGLFYPCHRKNPLNRFFSWIWTNYRFLRSSKNSNTLVISCEGEGKRGSRTKKIIELSWFYEVGVSLVRSPTKHEKIAASSHEALQGL